MLILIIPVVILRTVMLVVVIMTITLIVIVLQQPKTYPHPRIPAARLFSVFLCVPMFSSTWGNPEVGGGDNLLGS